MGLDTTGPGKSRPAGQRSDLSRIKHYVLRHPDQVRPALTDRELRAAHTWLEERAHLPAGS